MSSNIKRTSRMVLNVKKPSGEGGNNDEEAKQPHDADPTVAALVSKGDKEEGAERPHDADLKLAALNSKVDALDSKVDAVVVGSQKRKRTHFSKVNRVNMIKLIRENLVQSAGTEETAKNKIIASHGVAPSNYYKWTKDCILCEKIIKTVSSDCVPCSTKTCKVRLCYGCFGKTFTCKLSKTRTFLQVCAIDCAYCQVKDSVVVCEFGELQPTSTFNKDLFHQELLREIDQGVKECEQLLGKLTRDLAGFRHDLIEVLDSVNEKPFNQVEDDTVSSFTKFIQQYNGPEAADCDFVAKMKDVVRLSRWLNFNKIHPMDTQLGNLKMIHAQFVGVRAQMVDLAVLCHMSVVNRRGTRSTKCWFRPILKAFHSERTREREKRVRDEKERVESSSESEFPLEHGIEESNELINLTDSDVEDDSIDNLY